MTHFNTNFLLKPNLSKNNRKWIHVFVDIISSQYGSLQAHR